MKKAKEKEYLRQQLELLSKASQRSHPEFLPGITNAMCKIYLLIKLLHVLLEYIYCTTIHKLGLFCEKNY